MLLKSPGFTLTAVAALALGMGATTAIFSVVNAALLRSLPYENPDRIVAVWETTKSAGIVDFTSYPNVADWRAQNTVFEDVSAVRAGGFTLTGLGQAERIEGARVSPVFFPLLRVQAALGRTFLEEEDKPGAPRVVVMSQRLWMRKFGGDENLVGQSITLNNTPYTVIGILPANFSFPFEVQDAELWATTAYEGGFLTERGSRTNKAIARLKEGVSLNQAQAEMDTIAARLEQQYPESNTGNGARIIGLHDQLVGRIAFALWILLGAVVFVVLIACSNVANLLLARATARQKEIAIRSALGASRWRIARQMLIESVVLALVGGGAGLLLAVWGIEVIILYIPQEIARLSGIVIDARVLGFTMLMSIMTGLVFGLAPALKASQPDLNETLKEGGRSSASVGRGSLRSALVVSEVALVLVLLIGAGLLMKSFLRLRQVNPGFDAENVLTMRMNFSGAKYAEDTQRISFIDQALEKLKALPGVESAAFVAPPPFSDDNVGTSFSIVGRETPPGPGPSAVLHGITSDYFSVMKIPMIEGRNFNDRDVKGGTGAVIINRTLARRYWPDESPIGKRISSIAARVDDNEPTLWEIVGVVGDVKNTALDRKAAPELYLPIHQKVWRWGYMAIRSSGDPASLAPTARSELASIDKDLPFYKIRSLDEMVSASVAKPRFFMLLMGLFAALGLALAIVGVYGVISYLVSERTHEIGVRMALGASRSDILRMVLGRGMALAAGGIVIGLGGGFAVTRVIEALLYEVSATDPTIFGTVSGLLALVAAFACYVPAMRATRVDPMTALRYE
jgi:putative ABC transport system permease protein